VTLSTTEIMDFGSRSTTLAMAWKRIEYRLVRVATDRGHRLLTVVMDGVKF
jgi:hypothetical protein